MLRKYFDTGHAIVYVNVSHVKSLGALFINRFFNLKGEKLFKNTYCQLFEIIYRKVYAKLNFVLQ